MKLKKLLKYCDFLGLYIIIYSTEDYDHPLWEGSSLDIPWWIANMKILKPYSNPETEETVSYRHSLGENYNNNPGVVITVKED